MTIIPWSQISKPANSALLKRIVAMAGIIAYPTDTLYGLGGNFFDAKVMAAIDRLKGRTAAPYSVAVADLAMLKPLVDFIPAFFQQCHSQFLPGKFTFLFPVSPRLEPKLVKHSGKIGIRIPARAGIRHLISSLGVPLISTSVNRSGQKPLNDPQLISETFPEIDLLIDGGILPPSGGSTIIDLTLAIPKILRRGEEAERAEEAIIRWQNSHQY